MGEGDKIEVDHGVAKVEGAKIVGEDRFEDKDEGMIGLGWRLILGHTD